MARNYARKSEMKLRLRSGKQTPQYSFRSQKTAKLSKRQMKEVEKRNRNDSRLNRYLRRNQKIEKTTEKSLVTQTSVEEKLKEKFE